MLLHCSSFVKLAIVNAHIKYFYISALHAVFREISTEFDTVGDRRLNTCAQKMKYHGKR